MSKKILIISSSPRKGGNSDVLSIEKGYLFAGGVWQKGDVLNTNYLKQAYEAGKRIAE